MAEKAKKTTAAKKTAKTSSSVPTSSKTTKGQSKTTADKTKKTTTKVVEKKEKTTSATKKVAPKKVAEKKVVTPKTEKAVEQKVAVSKDDQSVEAAQESPKVEPAVEKADESKKSSTPTTTQQHNNITTYSPTFDLKEMLDTGAHFGHQAKRWHPKMAEYIHTKLDGVHIIDLIKTADQLKKACVFAYELGKSGKTLIFVGTKRQAREIVKTQAIEAGAMYIINRWLGGFISNWEQVAQSNKRMQEIRTGLEKGTFKHYTKKERVVLDKEAQRLERFFGGVAALRKNPDALFVIDVGREEVAVKEATEKGIPVIALVDTNCSPTDINFVIPANDDAVKSIEYFVTAIAQAYKAGTQARK